MTLPLNFKAYAHAEKLRSKILANAGAAIEDDYGTVANLMSDTVAGVVLIDLAKEIDRQYEFQVMQQSAAKKVQAVGGKIIQPVAMASMN